MSLLQSVIVMNQVQGSDGPAMSFKGKLFSLLKLESPNFEMVGDEVHQVRHDEVAGRVEGIVAADADGDGAADVVVPEDDRRVLTLVEFME